MFKCEECGEIVWEELEFYIDDGARRLCFCSEGCKAKRKERDWDYAFGYWD